MSDLEIMLNYYMTKNTEKRLLLQEVSNLLQEIVKITPTDEFGNINNSQSVKVLKLLEKTLEIV